MQTATSETESKSCDLSICVHHYTLRAPCPKGQGKMIAIRDAMAFVPKRDDLPCQIGGICGSARVSGGSRRGTSRCGVDLTPVRSRPQDVQACRGNH